MKYLNKGVITLLSLILATIFLWIFSLMISLFNYEIKSYKEEEKFFSKMEKLENIESLAEYELFLADIEINSGKYKDLIEYFEDSVPFWMIKKESSETNYRKESIILNDILILKDELYLLKNRENSLKVYLKKSENIDGKNIVYKVIIVYKYEKGEMDIKKFKKREILEIEVEEL